MRFTPLIFACAVVLPAGARAQQITLRDAIARAQKESYQANVATSTRDAARARDRQFGASLLPQLSLGGNLPVYNRSIIPVLQPDGSTIFRAQQQNQSSLTMNLTQLLPFTGGQLIVSSGLSRLAIVGAHDSRTWSSTPLSIGIRQNLLRSNSASWDAQAQDIRSDISERQYLEAREDLAVATAGTFFDYYAARVALENAQTNAGVLDSLYTLNKGRFEVGRIGRNDLLQSELALLRARSAVDGAQLELDRTLSALRLQLHLPAGAPLDVIVPAETPDIRPDTSLAVTQALKNTSQVRSFDLQDVTARRTISEAKYNTGVGGSVTASVGFNQTSPEMSAVYKDLLQAQQYSVSVQMPVWQWGSRGAQIAAAKSDQQRVASQTMQGREQLIQDAHFAALQLAQARRSLDIAAKADTVAADAFSVSRNRYAIGRIALQDLFTAQTSKDQAVLSYVQSLRGYWTAYYRLRRLTLYDFEAGQPIR